MAHTQTHHDLGKIATHATEARTHTQVAQLVLSIFPAQPEVVCVWSADNIFPDRSELDESG